MGKKLLLEYEEENPYYYIGISSSIPDYQMIFDLNKNLKLGLCHVDAFQFKKKNKEFIYSLYLHIDHENLVNYYLISNKYLANPLIPHLKQFDFFIILEGEINHEFVTKLGRSIMKLPRVMIAAQLEGDYFDKIQNLRYEFDLHLEKVLKII